MGWDTQITVLAENTGGRHFEIARMIFEQDAKNYLQYDFYKICFRKLPNDTVLFFTYERRKYLPYWVIQEISAVYKSVIFTVIASCPDHISGAAGLVKISNGAITDSYGFFDERQAITEQPDPEIIFNWFGTKKCEETIRQKYLSVFPMIWCDEDFTNNVIDFTDSESRQLEELLAKNRIIDVETNWIEITEDEFRN
jgi:hypothetical protein